jgi:hypothetical protein
MNSTQTNYQFSVASWASGVYLLEVVNEETGQAGVVKRLVVRD